MATVRRQGRPRSSWPRCGAVRQRAGALGAGHRGRRGRQLRLGPGHRPAALGRPAAADVRLRPGDVRPDDRGLQRPRAPRRPRAGDADALQAAIDTCGEYEVEYRVVLPGGETRWVHAPRPRAARRRRARRAHARRGVRHHRPAAARPRPGRPGAGGDVGGLLLPRPRLAVHLRQRRGRAAARAHAARSCSAGRSGSCSPRPSAATSRSNYRGGRGDRRGAGLRGLLPARRSTAGTSCAPGRRPDGLSVYFLDITERRRGAGAGRSGPPGGWRSSPRSPTELSDTLDAEEAVARLAAAASCPALADLVHRHARRRRTARLRDVGWAGTSTPSCRERWSSATRELRLESLKPTSAPVAAALRTGEPTVLADDVTRRVGALLRAGEARDLLLRARARVRGDPADAAPAGARVGPAEHLLRPGPDAASTPTRSRPPGTSPTAPALALDNARLYAPAARARRGAAAQPAHRRRRSPTTSRSSSATCRRREAAQVGGDWYDAFLQPDGATMLVIGDVVGHDTAAAAAMGQVRGLLRGIAYRQRAPARPQVLTRLDAAIEGLRVGTTATAVVARLEQTPEERGRGVTHLRWSNAGHPPPLVVTPDGEVLVLGGVEADLLLGVDPDRAAAPSRWSPSTAAPPCCSTPTGSSSAATQSLDDGMAPAARGARRAGRRCRWTSCATRCSSGCCRPAREDDVALVAVRLHRQDRPRPAEAGPKCVPPEVPAGPRPAADPQALSRRTVAFRPLIMVALSALMTSSAAGSGTSTSEKRSAISIAPMSRPRQPGLAGDGADEVLRADARARGPARRRAGVMAARRAGRAGARRRDPPGRPSGARAVGRGRDLAGSPRRRPAPPVASWASFTAASATSMTSNSSASVSTTTRKRSRSSLEQALAQRRRGSARAGGRAGRRPSAPSRSRSSAPVTRSMVLSMPVLARLGERDGDALAAGPADPADAVHVGLGRRRARRS